ncbi:MAG: metal ABC transporter solute-binding protein, Zn/Mn family [Candidatus Sumerlaeia bacterium]
MIIKNHREYAKTTFLWLVCLVLVISIFAGNGYAQDNTSPIKVFVTIPPQKWLVERLVPDAVEVHLMVPPGKSPHVYEPTPRQMVDLAKAELYLTVGASFEDAYIKRIARTYPDLQIIDSTKGINRRAMDETHDHEHGKPDDEDGQEHHGDHDHAAGHDEAHDEDENEDEHEDEHLDPHVWLSTDNLKIMARNTASALGEIIPEKAEAIDERLKNLIEEINQVQERLSKQLKPYAGSRVYVFHPAFGYFTDAFKLRQRSVEIEGKAPTPRQLNRLIKDARAAKVKILFVQPQFDQKSARAVASAINGAVVRLDPLEPDVLSNLQKIADEIEEAL